MPEKSGFFDSTADDMREYPARDFAEYFARFVTNGVFNGGQYLNPTASGQDANISLSPGYAWINGYVYSIYDSPLVLPIEPAAALDRIDRIVLRLDTSTPVRSIRALVVQGLPASNPVPPSLVRSGNIYDLSIAQVRVPANSTIITQANITDERLNQDVCGLVNSLIRVDTATFQAQWDAFMQDIQNQGFATTSYVDNRVLTGGFGTTTNSGNAYSVTVNPTPVALVAGLRITVKINAANTGAATINVNGLGAKSILKANGNAVTSGSLKANSVYTLVYNGSAFILQGEGGEYGTATAADVRSTKTIGTEAGLVSGSLVTRASSALTITPTPTDQVFQPGIYDGTITVKGANVRTTPDLSWLIGAFPSTQDALGQNYVDGRPYIDSQGNVYSGTISSVTAAHIQKRDRFGTLLSNVQVGNSGVTYITGKTVACRHGVYIYSVSSNTYRNFYDYSGNLLKANPTGHLGIAVRPVDIEWKSNKLYTFARSIGTTAHVLENDTILFTFSGSAYDYDSDIWILGVSEDMKLVGGDLGINLLYYNGSSWNRAFTTKKTVDSIMPFTFLISALLQAPAS